MNYLIKLGDIMLFVFFLGLYVFLREEYVLYWRLTYLVTVPFLTLLILTKRNFVFNLDHMLQVIFILVVLISYFVALDTNLVSDSMGRLIRIIIFSFIVGNYVVVFAKEKQFHMALILSGVVLSLYLVYTNIGNLNDIYRLSDDGLNANVIGINLSISLFSSIVLIYKYSKYKVFLSAPLMIYVMLLTGSRKALIMFGFLLLYAFLRSINLSKIKRNFKYIILAIIIGIIFYNNISTASVFDRLKNLTNFIFGNNVDEVSVNVRYLMIKEGYYAFLERPFLGYGLDNYRVIISGILYETYSHNNFIEILVGTGIVGLIVFYARYTIPFLNLQDKSDKTYLMLLIIILLIVDIGAVSYDYKVIQIYLSVIVMMYTKNYVIKLS